MNYNEARKSASYNMQMAMVAEVKGEIEESLRFFELAFEAEKQAALSLLANFDNEPTRSITFRSAAALAIDCKKYDEAKKMVHFGLAGNPPEDIARELMDIYERVHQEMRLLAIPSAAKATKTTKQQSYFWLQGILKMADAQKHKITIVSEDSQSATVIVPKGLGHIVRSYWDENVSAYILKQGKQLTLVEIDKGFLQRTA